jgi:hypothetical protein
MAILNNSNAISSGGYDINNSLRFRSSNSAYLSRTFTTPTNNKIFTWSGWVKRGQISTSTSQNLFRSGGGGSTTGFRFSDTTGDANMDGIRFFFDNGASGDLKTTQIFRDPSAWYHLVVAVDTTQATAANRVKMYINGNQITAFGTATYPAQNYTPQINSAIAHSIGIYLTGPQEPFDGYMADINFIDGQALTPSSFGETDTTTGSWKPKAYTSTYGTNGFYLKFSDIATTSGSNAGLGKDFSGNANYWTTNNISVTAGVTYDAMIDSPTLTSATVANYAVLNPIDKNLSNVTISNANLTLNTSDTNYGTRSTIFVSSGKWYWEATISAVGTSAVLVGIADAAWSENYVGSSSGSYGYFSQTGTKANNASFVSYGASYTTNDVIGIALDMDAGTLTFYKNNTSQGTAYTGLSGLFSPAFSGQTSSVINANFGQRPFSYTPPTGFVRLNTFNLPDSTIVKGNTVMNAITYTGNGSTQTVTGLDFTPGMLWIKDRSAITNHQVNDQVRGVGRELQPDETSAETNNNIVTAFNSNGFSISSNGNVNANGNSYVAWSWKANGAGSSNTSGSITSSVSVNATAGFSVVTYTGNGTSGATIGHGLGVAPKMIIVKSRSSAYGWSTYHASLGATYLLKLNTTAAATNVGVTGYWNNTAPTSTVFSIGNDAEVNLNTATFVAYCWAEIAGYSKFGSYVGNGSADGTFVYLGFRPEFIMVKKTNTGNNWVMEDSSRSSFNVVNKYLAADDPQAESTNSQVNIDFLSNGFKLRSAFDIVNAGDYIYMAFAENPFKNANAR